MEEIRFGEIMPVLKKRLDERLNKARIYPELLHACLRAARNLKAFQTLEKHGAKLYLLNKEVEATRSPHPIPEEFMKLYAVCKELNFTVFALDRNKQLFADTGVSYDNKMVAVHLGEWKPFIPFEGDPLEMDAVKFLNIYGDIQLYLIKLRRLGIDEEGPDLRIDRIKVDKPVLLIGHETASIDSDYWLIGYMNRYTEYFRAYTKKDLEDIKREEEERNERMREWDELQRKFEALIIKGRTANLDDDVSISEVSPEDVENILGIKLGDVARKVFVVRSGFGCLERQGIHAYIPISYLHARRYLETTGRPAFFVRPAWHSRGINFPFKLGICVSELYHDGDYYLILLPKRKLPPIKLARVVKSGKRITLVN